MIMNPSRADIISGTLNKGILQLLKISSNEAFQIQEMYEKLEDIESDKIEKIIEMLKKYGANIDDEVKFYKEIVEVLEKLLSHYEAQAELNKSIQEELNEFLIEFEEKIE